MRIGASGAHILCGQSGRLHAAYVCEDPLLSKISKYKEFAGNNYYWVGGVHYKSLGIFAKENIKLKKLKV